LSAISKPAGDCGQCVQYTGTVDTWHARNSPDPNTRTAAPASVARTGQWFRSAVACGWRGRAMPAAV